MAFVQTVKNSNSMDLFQHPNLIPDSINTIIESFNEHVDRETETLRMKIAMESVGYTFSFTDHFTPYNLRTVKPKKPSMRTQIEQLYLDYVNNFLTVERFAEYHSITSNKAHKIIDLGRTIHSNRSRNNHSFIKTEQ